MVFYGQLVTGPPASGKTTYCDGMQQMCSALHRPVIVVNLDPANDRVPYSVDIDIRELITIEDIMERQQLGPNGSLLFAVDYLWANIDWLEERLKKVPNSYLLIDCPGQVETYTHHSAMRNIMNRLQKELQCRLTVVHLVDAALCSDPVKYLSAGMLSLSAQLLLEMPQVNILSKIDTLPQFGDDMVFRINYYAEACQLSELLYQMPQSHPLEAKLRKFTEGIAELLEDFNLIGYSLLDIQSKESVLRVLRKVDVANGFAISPFMSEFETELDCIVGAWCDDSYQALYGQIEDDYLVNNIEETEMPSAPDSNI